MLFRFVLSNSLLLKHFRVSIEALAVIGSVELVRSANLEILVFLFSVAVAVGLLAHFLNGSLL